MAKVVYDGIYFALPEPSVMINTGRFERQGHRGGTINRKFSSQDCNLSKLLWNHMLNFGEAFLEVKPSNPAP